MKAADKDKLRERIRSLEGLTDDERSALLELLEDAKTYGLVWEDKPEAIEDRLRDELPVLREVKSHAIISDNADAPNHILIEGDNLVSLSTLAYTHAGKIDVIYIDPPYNTGNKDFVYNDSYVDSEDTYRHSKWLSFMAKRLKIAKKLLSDRGVIFISIDDNEAAALKMLCDDKKRGLFGEQNFIAQLIWSGGRKNDSKFISVSHEYVLIYVKNIDYLRENKITWRERKQGIDDIYATLKKLKKLYNDDYVTISSELKKWFKSLPANHPAKDHSHYCKVDERGIYFPDNISWPGGGGPKYAVLHPITNKPVKIPSRGWIYSEETMREKISQNLVQFGADENAVPCIKSYLADRELSVPYSVIYQDGRAATKRLMEMFGDKRFNNPKDEEILKRFLSFTSLPSSTVLDFFAGSGTTLHAVMQLNAEDGGKRQCILCTNNENGICENVTYERNKRVIRGYTKPNGEAVEGLYDNNLRYYQTERVGRSRSLRNMQKLVNLSTDMLCIKENLYTEQSAFGGVKTHPQIFRFFDDGTKQMLVIYREEYIEQIVDLIYNYNIDVANPIKVYVFSPSEDPATELFEPVADKVEPVALPAAIYNTYKRVLPKNRNRLLTPQDDVLVVGEEEETLGGLFNEKGGEE